MGTTKVAGIKRGRDSAKKTLKSLQAAAEKAKKEYDRLDYLYCEEAGDQEFERAMETEAEFYRDRYRQWREAAKQAGSQLAHEIRTLNYREQAGLNPEPPALPCGWTVSRAIDQIAWHDIRLLVDKTHEDYEGLPNTIISLPGFKMAAMISEPALRHYLRRLILECFGEDGEGMVDSITEMFRRRVGRLPMPWNGG